MSDPRDYKLDLGGAGGAAPSETPDRSGTAAGGASGVKLNTQRPYLSVHFACCGVYQRVYRSPDGTAYSGRCPRCAVPVRFVVGQGGTAARSFVVR